MANTGATAGAKADDAPEANRSITLDNGALATKHKKPQKTTPTTQKEKTNENHHLPRYLFLILISQPFCRTDILKSSEPKQTFRVISAGSQG